MSVRRPHARSFALALAALVTAIPFGAARAQSPQSELGYVGTGDALVQTTIAGVPVSLGANVAFEERGARIRLDVLSASLQGSASGLSGALATQLFPAGGFTIVYDRNDSTYVVWSAARHAYFIGGGKSTAATPAPAPAATPSAVDPLGFFGLLRSLKDDQTLSASLTLAGHSLLFGHPVSNVHYALERVTLSGDALDVHGDLAIAEDLSGVPLQFSVNVLAKSIPQSLVRIELPQLAKRLPPESDFAPPPDYARATSIGDAIGGKITPTL